MKTTTSIKLDQDVKRKAQKLAEDFGLNLSGLVNAQLRQFLRDQQLILSETPRMSPFLEQLLGPIERDIQKGRNLSKHVQNKKELDRLFADL